MSAYKFEPRIACVVVLLSTAMAIVFRYSVGGVEPALDSPVHDIGHIHAGTGADVSIRGAGRRPRKIEAPNSGRDSAPNQSIASRMVDVLQDGTVSGNSLLILGAPKGTLLRIKDEIHAAVAALQTEMAVAQGSVRLSSEFPTVRLDPLPQAMIADEMDFLKERLQIHASPRVVAEIVAVLSRNLTSIYGDPVTVTMTDTVWANGRSLNELACSLEVRSEKSGDLLFSTPRSFEELFPHVVIQRTKINSRDASYRKYQMYKHSLDRQ